VPLVCLGVEHARANSLPAAEAAFRAALALAPEDAATLNELGALLYRQNQYAAGPSMHERPCARVSMHI
jgi:Tfp pilus assembly protein PilF